MHREDLPSGLRLGSGWFFHVAFAVVVFIVLYMLAALVTVTVRAGGPPTRLSGLGFSLDWEKALEIANSGVESLEQLDGRVSEAQGQLSTLIKIGRETQEALVTIADAHPAIPSHVKKDAAARVQLLSQLPERTAGEGERTAEVIARFRTNLADIERLHEEMTRT